jgi:hypothetical protein
LLVHPDDFMPPTDPRFYLAGLSAIFLMTCCTVRSALVFPYQDISPLVLCLKTAGMARETFRPVETPTRRLTYDPQNSKSAAAFGTRR